MASLNRNVGIDAARIGGNSPEMDVAANRTRAKVLGLLASHNKTGSYSSKVSVSNVAGKRRVRDRLVKTTDAQALHIEYGHWFTKWDGSKKWVKGLFIFRNAHSRMGS